MAKPPTKLLSDALITTSEGQQKLGDAIAALQVSYPAVAIASQEAANSAGIAVAAKTDAIGAAQSVGSYTTLALANAALASIPADKGVYVTADGANNGYYVKRSGVLVRESTATVPALDSRIPTGSPAPMITQNTDAANKTILGVGVDGRTYAASAQGLWAYPQPDMLNPLGPDGFPVHLGSVTPYTGAVTTAAYNRIPDDYTSVFYCIPVVGQSLAGGANDNNADVLISTVPVYPGKALMPAIGLKPDGQDFDTLVDLIEAAGTGFDTNKETMCSGLINGLIGLCDTNFGVQPNFGSFIASRGARTWPQIGPGNDAWSGLAKGLRGMVKGARARGLRPVVPALVYFQGEQDRGSGLTRIEIARNRMNLAREVRNLVRSITHQAEDPIVFVSQPANSVATDGLIPDHMLGPVDADGVEGIRLLPPNYTMTMSWQPGSSGVHPSSAAYLAKGGEVARCIFEECFGPGYVNLRVQEARWVSSTQVDLVYTLRTGSLVVDTSGSVVTVPAYGLNGFQLFDTTGSPPAISGMSVVADPNVAVSLSRILRLTFASRPLGVARLHYATRNDGVDSSTGANAGPLTGARGCIRSNASNPVWASHQVIPLGNAPA